MRVPVGRNEVRGLVGVRNSLAGFIVRRGRQGRKIGKGEVEVGTVEEPFLPPTLDDERMCKRCYSLDPCMLYRKVRFFIFYSNDLILYIPNS